MELPDRMEVEAAFARKLAKLSATHRRRLRELIGFPPDPARVPESFWAEVEQETREQAAAALLLIWMASAQANSTSDARRSTAAPDLLVGGQGYATSRGGELASRYVTAARGKLAGIVSRTADRVRQRSTDPDAGPLLTRTDWERELGEMFPDSDASRTAASETTDAQTAGGEGGARATGGISEQDLWITEDDARVCPICAPLHEQPRSVWSQQFPRGPKAHENCRCYLQYAFQLAGASA